MSWIKGRALWVRRGREARGVVLVIRKSLGKAVRRNRLKRRLRSLCRERPALPPSLVILPQRFAVDTSYKDLGLELDSLLARVAPRQQ